jgi:selenide,water dikinase
MQASAQPVLRDLVLVGGGHSHVGVVRRFAMRPEPGVRVTLICADVDTPYSGMLPGYIAGHYRFDDVHIDLARLCAWAGARFFQSAVIGIDRARKEVLLRDRPPLPYDYLSINIGSTPNMRAIEGATQYAMPVKPIAQFNERWLDLLNQIHQMDPPPAHPLRVAVVGAGAGGVELLLSVQYRLQTELRSRGIDPDTRLAFALVSASSGILPTHNVRVQARFRAVLAQRGVTVHTHARVMAVRPDALSIADGRTIEADRVLWVTQAGGAPWLHSTGLSLDEGGFIRVNDRLQSIDDPLIFAAGDIASFDNRPLEKAGVFAVRMGRALARNLRSALRGEPLRPYRPQRHWLALISTGGRHAVASRGPISFAGDWVWRWKDWIDRLFMRQYNELPDMPEQAQPRAAVSTLPLEPDESLQALSAMAMRCGGCGAKVGATVLSRALSDLRPVQRDDVLIGLHAPDDAAVLAIPPGMALVQTVDFFRAFIDDPYRLGRIAAQHALGDIFAMGAEPQSATAIVTVPPGLERQTEATLRQLMQGAVSVLNEAGCALVGGHTGEGQELAIGFAINGLIDARLQSMMTKGAMRPGEHLILTKPIGTGTLFAAHARHAARGRWIAGALTSMQQSSQIASQILRAHGARACTDVTGFGLLGHLIEMTRPSGVDVSLSLDSIPALDGALECVRLGILSSLQPANLRLRRAVRNPGPYLNDARYTLLFDPQTAGGLLASLPPDAAAPCLAALRQAGYAEAALIGRVTEPTGALEAITLED